MAMTFLYTAIASLYFYKERYRYFQEQKVQNKLEFSECQRLERMLPSAPKCKMKQVILQNKVYIILKDIALTFIFALLLFLPFGYLLARLSLKPMRDSVKAMDGFINGIVHDINTPLSVIRMNTQSISKNIDDLKLKKKSQRVTQAVEQIESLEEQLLFSLKIGQYELEYKKFDLGLLLINREEYWNDIRSTIDVNVTAESLVINGDEKALLRMIDNIVNNAVKYSFAKKSVKVVLKDMKLEIIDNGIGIKRPKEIFEKYYRESNDIKGVGIGLYIVAQIARLHGLKINVDSKLNRGTTFSIDISSITTSTLHSKEV